MECQVGLPGTGETAAARSTVIVCGHQELLIILHRLPLVGQFLDAMSVGYHFAFFVIASRHGNIHFVVHPVNHIEVVGAKSVPVQQSLTCG